MNYPAFMLLPPTCSPILDDKLGLRGVVLQSIPPVEWVALRISMDLVRLSLGIEEGDLVTDVEEALEWAVEGWQREE